nr:hypothetical protein [Tanacetum cinerariifolium]
MAMLLIKVHRFKKKHGRKIKFNGRENARFDKKLVKCFNCKKMGHFFRECRAQGGRNSNNYQTYKEAGKDGTDSKAMVVVDGREVVSTDDVISTDVSVSAGPVAAAAAAISDSAGLVAAVSPHSETEFAFMGLSTEAKWNNSGKNLYKLINSSVSIRTKRGLGLDKYIGEGGLSIDDSKFSIFHTNSDELEGQPIYNRFASVDHMKAVPPPLIGNYMPPSNIPDIDESQMVYRKKTTDSSEIKTNDDNISHSHDSVLFYFSDRSLNPSTNDFQMCDSSQECSRPNNSDHDSNSSVSASASESSDTIVIDCARQEDFPSVCRIETDVKSFNTLCNKFRSFNKESHFRKHKYDVSKSCYVCGSYLHLIKDCDFHEQRFTKRNAKGKGILKSRPTWKPVNPNHPKPVSAGYPKPIYAGRPNPISAGRPNPISAYQPNPVSADQPNKVSAGDGILGPGPLNIQSKSTYFHSFTHKNQQIFFLITHNSLYSLYLTCGLNGKTVVKPSAGNKDKLEDFEDFHGGEVTFGGSTGKITGKGTIKTKNLNFENVLYVEELQHFNLISISQIYDQSHRVLFTENECLVLSKDFPFPDSSMVILSILRKHNLYTFSLNELNPKDALTCLIAKALQNESTLWHIRLGHGTGDQALSVSSTNLTVGSTPSNAGSQEDDSDSDDEPDVLIIQSTPTPVVLQRQEQAGKEEVNRLGLAFPSLNLLLGVGTSSISSFVSAGSKPPVFASSIPQMSPCASLISAGRPTGSADRPVSAGRPTGSAGRPVSASRPPSSAGRLSGFTDRSSVPAGHILGQSNASTSSERFSCTFSMNKLDIHNGLTIFNCPKSGIFTSSSYDEDFFGPDANNLESSLNVSSTITKRIHNIHLTSQVIGDINSPVQTRSQALTVPDWVEAMQAEMQQFLNQKVGIVCRNKARLVAQGHRQEEGIDYTDVFAPVARIEAIRLFLAFDSFIRFKVYQMDMKSAFLYGKIAEEVYVTQPEAPRAWYERLSTFLLKHGYRRGSINQTLFIKKDSNDLMLVQVYVDDIMFGSKRKDWCKDFKTLMQSEFEMSSMRPLTFFLGLQVDQRPDGIFIHQETPDIMFVVCAAARHQVTPKTSNLLSVKRIFKYLTSYPKLGLWYPRDSPFDLKAFPDSDYAGVDPAVVISAGDADSAGTFISAGVSVAASPSVASAPSSPIRDPAKGKAIATPSSPIIALSAKELADQQAAILEAKRQELLEQELKQSLDAEQVYLDNRIALNLTNEEWIDLVDQVRVNPTLSAELLGADVSEDTFFVRMVELMNLWRKAIAEMKAKAKVLTTQNNQQNCQKLHLFLLVPHLLLVIPFLLFLYSAVHSVFVVPSVSTVLFVYVIPFVFAASSIPAETPIAAGVSITAGVSELAFVPIIDLLDSPSKATSLPLDPETAEQVVPLRKSSRKKSMARRRTLPRPSQSKSDALPFDEDDPEAEFKKYLRPVSDDDEPAEPVSLSLVSNIHTWEIFPTEFGLGEIHVITRADGTVKRFSTLRELMYWEGRADLMVLYGMVSDKYKLKRATGIGLGLWINGRFYALPAIHVLETEAGDIMYMFVDKKYPILPTTIQRMLNHGLEIDRDLSGNDLTTAIQLIQSLLNQLHPAT